MSNESCSEGEGARNATNHLARRRRPAEIPEVGGTRCLVLLKNNGESFASGYFIPHRCIWFWPCLLWIIGWSAIRFICRRNLLLYRIIDSQRLVFGYSDLVEVKRRPVMFCSGLRNVNIWFLLKRTSPSLDPVALMVSGTLPSEMNFPPCTGPELEMAFAKCVARNKIHGQSAWPPETNPLDVKA